MFCLFLKEVKATELYENAEIAKTQPKDNGSTSLTLQRHRDCSPHLERPFLGCEKYNSSWILAFSSRADVTKKEPGADS